MKSLSPNFFVRNMDETMKFYSVLGFRISMKVPDDGEIIWCMMTNGNVSVMFQTFDSLGNELPQISRNDGGSLLLYVQAYKIRDFYEKIRNKVTVIKEPEVTFYGATEFTILDNNNYLLTFAEDEQSDK